MSAEDKQKKRMHERIKEKLIQKWIEKNQKTIGLKSFE